MTNSDNNAYFVAEAQSFGVTELQHLDVKTVEEMILSHGIVVLKGFKATTNIEMENFAKQLGELLEWDFGYTLELKINENPQNHIFSQGKVEMHWDGAFADKVPRFNFFQCIESSATSGGGETTFINTHKLYNALPDNIRTDLANKVIRYTADKKAHYGGTIQESLYSEHPTTAEPRLRYIEPFNEDNMDVNPVHTQVLGMDNENSDCFLRQFNELIYASPYFYSHQWSKGDYVLVDNHVMLHGRNRFQGAGLSRHLKRIHIL